MQTILLKISAECTYKITSESVRASGLTLSVTNITHFVSIPLTRAQKTNKGSGQEVFTHLS